jgi:hypothetical protein
MQDDFSALDLLSIGGFRLSSVPPQGPVRKKKRFVGHRHKSNVAGKRGFSSFFPLFGGKIRRSAPFGRLQGWPMSLSWPTKEFDTPDLGIDYLDRPML